MVDLNRKSSKDGYNQEASAAHKERWRWKEPLERNEHQYHHREQHREQPEQEEEKFEESQRITTSPQTEPETISPLMFISVETAKQYCILRAISKTIVSPLDRVKYIMQCQKELIRTKALPHEFTSSLSCARYLAKMEGISRFWRGNLIQVVSVLPILQAQLFIGLPAQMWILKTSSEFTRGDNKLWSDAAALGGVISACMISYPLEYARFRLAVDLRSSAEKPYLFRHSLDFFAHRTFADSPHLLYTGMSIYILGSLVYQSIHNSLLHILFPYLPPDRQDGSWVPMVVQIMSGFAVVGAATLCLHPLDLVRRRMMIAVTYGHSLRYTSTRECFKSIWRSEGLRGLYRGSVISLVRMVATTGLAAAGLQGETNKFD